MDETALLSERTLLRWEISLHLDCVLCTTILPRRRDADSNRRRETPTTQRSIAVVLFVNDGKRAHIWSQCCRLFAAPPPGDRNSERHGIPFVQRLFHEKFA
jgi:hypothetical protein